MAGSSKSTDDSISLDIRHMRKNGLLSLGKTGTFTWRYGEQKIGTINFRTYDDSIKLYYKYMDDGESVTVSNIIYLDKTPCNYGNSRSWLLCPDCNSRRDVLYFYNNHFVCRKCADLNYQCQHEQPLARMQRRARKIRNKLKTDWLEPDNLSSPVLLKPKFMHESTFNRLRRKQVQLINASGQVMLDRFG